MCNISIVIILLTISRETVVILSQHAVQGKLTGADTALARSVQAKSGLIVKGKVNTKLIRADTVLAKSV